MSELAAKVEVLNDLLNRFTPAQLDDLHDDMLAHADTLESPNEARAQELLARVLEEAARCRREGEPVRLKVVEYDSGHVDPHNSDTHAA